MTARYLLWILCYLQPKRRGVGRLGARAAARRLGSEARTTRGDQGHLMLRDCIFTTIRGDKGHLVGMQSMLWVPAPGGELVDREAEQLLQPTRRHQRWGPGLAVGESSVI